MKIVIAGTGEVGFHLAKLLTDEAQDIYLIDADEERLKYADSHLDVITLKGDATSIKTLQSANIKNADLLISVTSSQEANILSAILGKKLGAKYTIARIQNYEYISRRHIVDFKELGVDALFSARDLAAREILRLVQQSALTDNFEFADGHLSLIGTTLDSRSVLVEKTVADSKEFNPNMQFLPVAILRGNKTIIPRGATIFKKNDHIYFTTKKETIPGILKLCGTENVDIHNVMILGGSFIGEIAAEMLQDHYSVKLIEKDRQRCMKLVENLQNTLVIHADGREVEVLETENLSEMDAFISVTGDSETNIISCLVAKTHGVKKTIASVENIDYINLSQNIGVDTLINRKLIAASNIFRHVRKGEVSNIAALHGVEAEIIEFTAREKTRIVKKPIKDLDFPKSAIIGGIIRNGAEVTFPLGEFQIKPGDHVVVVSFEECVNKVEKFF
ncbi:MAG: Trk system potassium transporter TrkA [Bacteroidetes bacterium]|nr:Trk system potassium transporter TrkA [Bacteroidota bacterium]